MSGLLKCAGCNYRCIEPGDDDKGEDGYSSRYCGDCIVDKGLPSPEEQNFLTLVAGWETVADDEGSTISTDLLPVVITVEATTVADAIEMASDRLQAHFGTSVEQLYADDIERDDWFGLNERDAYLRLCAVFKGAPRLVNDEQLFTVIR
ncbi:hypothetical protein [Actinacidiphila sp. ITFR-21]|uniref:hypothetical protein n=1 Tax=Actinacidiphila sp. ITFR-21 TaxID=3075199 RepID=UPI00288C0525|nr:hypothetical protein [Streptomyces sp. ITFR-21]WNI17685.1 hypothetical protein RLT57_20560 [Streptomyces sp. ITFR-21]WNI17825.1 hypothetical protein RLT57_21275 [Streptomyces sp. ITFR-21]